MKYRHRMGVGWKQDFAMKSSFCKNATCTLHYIIYRHLIGKIGKILW